MEERVCKRCLLKEASEEDYKNIEKYILAIDEKDRVKEDKYLSRLAICKECEYLNAGTCLSCGCYVEIRAYSSAGACPKKKW